MKMQWNMASWGNGSIDYEAMAQEAARERDVLRALLRARQEKGPASPGEDQIWQRDNKLLYAMYLEQRSNSREFARRAQRQ